MTVGLVDYGAGNFASVWNALQQHTSSLIGVADAAALERCSHVVLPGVGAFSAAMDRLSNLGLVEPIRRLLDRGDVPFLGICVGMQILAARGTEFSPTPGLGIVAGSVEKFDFSRRPQSLLLPHMGWNDVEAPEHSALFHGIDPEDCSFYFLHSYRLVSEDPAARFAHCQYGESFIAALEKGRTYGVQFHPEKSQRNGHLVIANFLGVRSD